MPTEYERRLRDEIWGCFKYIGIPMETIMKLPIQERKYYIYKHNQEQENNKEYNDKNISKYTGKDLNNFARNEQNLRKK